MSKAADWNERYRRGEHDTKEPSALLVDVVEGLSPGRALDIACGTGRHAIYLAAHGWKVTAVDSSSVGIEIAEQRAKESGAKIETVVADLKRGEFAIKPESFDLILDFYYLQRDLFPKIRDGVRPGGLVIAAIHLRDDAPNIKPMNPAFLLDPGELSGFFENWTVERYSETPGIDEDHGDHTRRSALIVARKPE